MTTNVQTAVSLLNFYDIWLKLGQVNGMSTFFPAKEVRAAVLATGTAGNNARVSAIVKLLGQGQLQDGSKIIFNFFVFCWVGAGGG